MGLKGVLRLLWAATLGALGPPPNSVDPETGQTNYGVFVGREERARLEAFDAESGPPLAGPMSGDLRVDLQREYLAPLPPMLP